MHGQFAGRGKQRLVSLEKQARYPCKDADWSSNEIRFFKFTEFLEPTLKKWPGSLIKPKPKPKPLCSGIIFMVDESGERKDMWQQSVCTCPRQRPGSESWFTLTFTLHHQRLTVLLPKFNVPHSVFSFWHRASGDVGYSHCRPGGTRRCGCRPPDTLIRTCTIGANILLKSFLSTTSTLQASYTRAGSETHSLLKSAVVVQVRAN